MEMLVNKKYVLTKIDKKALKIFGFRRYSKYFGDEKENYYSLRFPILKYFKSTTVEGEIIVNLDDGSVKINAYNYGTNGFYPPFYQEKCNKVYETIIKKINSKFYEIFDKVGIKQITV